MPGSADANPASQVFLRSIIDALSAHIAILDDRGVVLEVNEAWRRFATEHGYRGTTFGVGEAYLGVCDSAAADGIDDACQMATGIRGVICGISGSFRHHYRCDLPSGPRWYQARVTRFEVAGEAYTVVAHEDVTEIRRADDAARESDQRLRALLTGAPIALFALDREGVCTVLTGDGLRNAGLKEGELVGRSMFELYREDPAIIDSFRRAIRGEAFTSVNQAHGRVWETRYSPMYDAAGMLVGTIGAAFDATERHRSEAELARHRDHLEALVLERTEALERTHVQLAQRDRLASLGTLAAGLGHDIANLLLPMKCHLDELQSALGPARCVADIAALREAMELLRQLCDGLRLCTLDPRNHRASSDTTDLAAWWRQFGPVICSSIPPQVRVDVEFPRDAVRLAIAPHQISQAVLNLIVNAVEAISGTGAITIRALVDSARSTATMQVIDSGIGMPAEVLKHAFEPFFTTKKRGRSTGLGLYLVHSVITAAGGTVVIDSTKARGTTITMTIPVAGLGSPAGSEPDSPFEESPVVAVTIPDARRSALWMQVLRAAGFTPIRADEGDPDDADVWLTTAEASRLDIARKFVSGEPHRRVVVYGPLPADWADLGVKAVDENHGLEGVREALRIAAGPITRPATNGRSHQ